MFQLIDAMLHYCLVTQHKSYYAVAKEAGLRIDIIKRMEQHQGAVKSYADFVHYFCRCYPEVAYKLYYNMASVVAQLQRPQAAALHSSVKH